jgi:hypothetical protein
MLIGKESGWVDRFIKEGPDALAKSLVTSVLTPAAFPRRVFTLEGPEVPNVEGIGQSEAFVDRVFDAATAVHEAGGVAAATLKDRVAPVPLDRQLSLYIVRVDEFKPITRTQYLQYAPRGVASIQQWIMSEVKDDPFSEQSLSKRLNYVSETPATSEPSGTQEEG